MEKTLQAVSMFIYPLTGDTHWTKYQPLLWLNLVTLGIKKVVIDMCVFTSQVLVTTKCFVPLKDASVRVELNQRLYLSFGEQGSFFFKETILQIWCAIFLKDNHWSKRRVFLEWANTHMCQTSADNHTKEYGSKEELLILQYNLDDKVQKNNKICVRMAPINFLVFTYWVHIWLGSSWCRHRK